MSQDHAQEPLDVQPQERFSLLEQAPWWLISAGIHVVLLLAATLVCMEMQSEIDPGEFPIVLRPHVPPPIDTDISKISAGDIHRIPVEDPNAPPTDQQPIVFPEAELSNKNRSNDNDHEHDDIKGLSREALAHLDGGGTEGMIGRKRDGEMGIDTLGLGPGEGAPGLYGGRFGSDRNTRMCTKGGSTDTIRAANGALGWLARHQSTDGSWKGSGYCDQCVGPKCSGMAEESCDAGLTGLSLLAFLGAGITHLDRRTYANPMRPGAKVRYGEVVMKAIKWLVTNQDSDGCVGPHTGKMMYNHAIATLALCEAYGMTESQILKEPAQKAIDFLVQAQNPYRVWRYSPRCSDNDTSVTGWCVMALKSAAASGLQTSGEAMALSRKWIEDVTEKSYGKVGYQSLQDAGVKVQVEGKNGDFQGHESLTAVGMMVRIWADKNRKDPMLEMGAKLLAGDLPQWSRERKTIDYYYWYYATLALFQYDGPDSGGSQRYWKPWNEAMKAALTKNQHTAADGCAQGSWDSDGDRWAWAGGRVCATAMNALTMEVYSRYPNVFGSMAREKKAQ